MTRFWQREIAAEAQPNWLRATRLGLITFTLGAWNWLSQLPDGQASGVSALVFGASTSAAVCLLAGYFLPLRGRAQVLSSYIQLFLDALLASIIVYVTGGPFSPFLFLYLGLVMVAGIAHARRGAFLLTSVCGSLYLLMVWALIRQLLPMPDRSGLMGAPPGGYPLQIVGLCSAMVLIGIATTYLSRAIRSRDRLVAHSIKALTDLTEKHHGLMNSIPNGLVTTQLDGSIVSINTAAAQLLRVDPIKDMGRSLFAILRELDSTCAVGDSLQFSGDISGEVEIATSGASGGKLRLSYIGRSIGEAEQPSGFMFVFQDVTQQRSIEEQLELQERMARLLARSDTDESRNLQTRLSEFVGESAVMLKVYKLIDRVATSDATVLIHGESGTGKELVARAIHLGSVRSRYQFVPVNCGAIPENLIESELFGHKKGSFTGAHADSQGMFRQAAGGTIFLDEIAELPSPMQAKLLRTLQDKTVRPVGGERDISVDVRILAATNKNLKKEVEAGRFREDLYYRLNVISINLPPLRERKEDIPLLVDSLLRKFVPANSQAIVPPQTMRLLLNYNYPGNVRELENILERAFVLGGLVILPEHLPDNVRALASENALGAYADGGAPGDTKIIIDQSIQFPVSLDDILANVERKYLQLALAQTHGARKRAAELLGINFRSFRYRLQKFGIGEPGGDE